MQISENIMHNDENIEISIVVPIFNEELVLAEFYNRITNVIRPMKKIYEIIFVDDGSGDNSPLILQNIAQNDKYVEVIRFSRNFGQHIAITAGLDYSKGNLVVIMDADLQDKPEEMPKLLEKINEGYDVVFAIHKNKDFFSFKQLTSSMFNWLINRIAKFPVPLNTSIFRVLRRKVVKNINKFRERERFIVGIISYLGFRQTGVIVERGRRPAGRSKYSLSKMIRLAINGATSFSQIPLKLASFIGVICTAISLFIGMSLVMQHFLGSIIESWKLLFLLIIFIGGIQFIFIGILGEYIGRIFSEAQNRPLYIIDYIINEQGRRGI